MDSVECPLCEDAADVACANVLACAPLEESRSAGANPQQLEQPQKEASRKARGHFQHSPTWSTGGGLSVNA